MRRVYGLIAIIPALAAPALADKKAAPNKYVRAAADAFTEALAADDKGDLAAATGLYEKALAIAPHPSTAYNLADVYRRRGDVRRAIVHFEMYLAMVPANAPDRATVTALVAQLEQTPGRLLLGTTPTSDPHAVTFREFYILVDGAIAAKPGTEPAVVHVPPGQPDGNGLPVIALDIAGTGKHQIDLVSSISYAHEVCEVIAGATRECTVTAKPRIDGHIVIDTLDNNFDIYLDPSDHDHSVSGGRYELSHGHHKLALFDQSFECPPIDVDVPGGPNDVVYLAVSSKDYRGRLGRCRKVDVAVRKLHFAP